MANEIIQERNNNYLVDIDAGVTNRQEVHNKPFHLFHRNQQAQELEQKPVFVLATAIVELNKDSLICNIWNRCQVRSYNRTGKLRTSRELIEEPVQGAASDCIFKCDKVLR